MNELQKKEMIERSKKHAEMDILCSGIYWEAIAASEHDDDESEVAAEGNWRGCSVGCHAADILAGPGRTREEDILTSDCPHETVANHYGVPTRLVRLQDYMFERMSYTRDNSRVKQQEFHVKFAESLPVTEDWTAVTDQLVRVILEEPLTLLSSATGPLAFSSGQEIDENGRERLVQALQSASSLVSCTDEHYEQFHRSLLPSGVTGYVHASELQVGWQKEPDGLQVNSFLREVAFAIAAAGGLAYSVNPRDSQFRYEQDVDRGLMSLLEYSQAVCLRFHANVLDRQYEPMSDRVIDAILATLSSFNQASS